MFGGTSHPPPTTSTDSEPERKNEEVDNKKDLVSSLLSETVSDLHTTADMDTHSKYGVIEIVIVFGFRCWPSKKDLGVTGFVKRRACTLKATLLIESQPNVTSIL
jgi:hypothetical protein